MIMMVGITAVFVGGNRTPFYNCRALWVVFSNDHLVTLCFVGIHYVGSAAAFVRLVASTVSQVNVSATASSKSPLTNTTLAECRSESGNFIPSSST